MDVTAIAWTDHTFNPWMGCTKISSGCAHCYAETLTQDRMGLSVWGPKATRQVTSASNWKKPLQWERDAAKRNTVDRTFSGSLCDVFEDHPVANATRPKLFDLIRHTPHLHWQLLTKRPENIMVNLPSDWGKDGWPNVWLGTSVENMKVAGRVDFLCEIPAVVRFISYEPALGPLDDLDLYGLDWVIYGGESGPNYRPEDKNWARTMYAKCQDEGVAFFHKQSAARRTEMGIELDGKIVRNYPIPRTAPALASLFG